MSVSSARIIRIATAVSFLGAGILGLAGMLATPWETERTTASYLEAMAASPTHGQIAAILLHFGYLLMVPAAFGALFLFRRRAVVLGHVAVAMMVLGWGTLNGFVVVDFYDIALATTLPLETAVEVEDTAAGYGGAIVMVLPAFIGAIFGLPLLGVALWRANVAPVWVPVLLTAGIAIIFISQIGLLAMGGAFALILIAFAYVAVRVLRLSDSEWESGDVAPAHALIPAGRVSVLTAREA